MWAMILAGHRQTVNTVQQKAKIVAAMELAKKVLPSLCLWNISILI
jgi:hypothetical protein